MKTPDCQIDDMVVRSHPTEGTVVGTVFAIKGKTIRAHWNSVYSSDEWVPLDEVTILKRSVE